MTNIGIIGWFPVSDTSQKVKFGKVTDIIYYSKFSVHQITFEDGSKSYLKNYDKKENNDN